MALPPQLAALTARRRVRWWTGLAFLLALGPLSPAGDSSSAVGMGARPLAAQLPVDVEVGASREVLSGDREPWEEYWIRATYRPATGTFIYGGARYTNRFGQEDQQYEAGTGFPLRDRWSLRADGSWSPTHRVVPIWRATGTVRHRPAAGWTLLAGGGREEWDARTVTRQHAGVERSFERFAVGYRLGFHQTDPGRNGIRHDFTGTAFYGERGNSISLGLGIGREAVPVAAGEVRSTTFRSARLSGIHWLDGQTGIDYHFAVHRHGPFFTRTTSRIGIRRRF